MSAMLIRILTVVFLALTTAACEAVGVVFEAGIWVGALVVILVLGIVGVIASKMRR